MKNKKSLLCICSSIYQVITLTQIITTFYTDYHVDIIFTNYMKEYQTIANEYQNTNLCRNVYAINVDFIRYSKTNSSATPSYQFAYSYDELLIHNFGEVCTFFVNSLELQLNKLVTLSLYEDGLSSYSKIYKRFYANATTRLKKIKQIYAFEPKYFDWNPPFKITKIPKICANNNLVKLLNKVFRFNNQITISSPIIYVESIAHLYGYDLQEQILLTTIANAIGKNNLIIKNHPRNDSYQINGLNYLEQNFQYVPFELLLLNQKVNDKILLTISSNGVYSAAIMFDIPIFSISLLDCINAKSDIINIELEQCIKKIHTNVPNSFYMPRNISDVIEIIQKKLSSIPDC